jgi:hypothetical protein
MRPITTLPSVVRADNHTAAAPVDNGVASHSARSLFLCAGLQSSGSTLLSWCFLQRRDMDGILDGRGDVLPAIPGNLAAPRTWCKFTISAFRLRDMMVRYEADGWQVHPLLLVRDVRSVFNSLIAKPYGNNGVTAEEPPLRLRLLRFKEDWQLAQAEGWPIVRYESLVEQPQTTLAQACDQLGVPWDPAMLAWPKRLADIAYPCNGNETFQRTRAATFGDSVRPELARLAVHRIPARDLAWLEHEFADFNAELGYPLTAEPAAGHMAEAQLIPRFENTRRYRHLCRRNRLAWLGHWIPWMRWQWQRVYLKSIGWL